MTILKVIEVLSESNKGWEDAAQNAISKVAETVTNVRSIYIKEMEAKVENNRITQYRINAKVTFEIIPKK